MLSIYFLILSTAASHASAIGFLPSVRPSLHPICAICIVAFQSEFMPGAVPVQRFHFHTVLNIVSHSFQYYMIQLYKLCFFVLFSMFIMFHVKHCFYIYLCNKKRVYIHTLFSLYFYRNFMPFLSEIFSFRKSMLFSTSLSSPISSETKDNTKKVIINTFIIFQVLRFFRMRSLSAYYTNRERDIILTCYSLCTNFFKKACDCFFDCIFVINKIFPAVFPIIQLFDCFCSHARHIIIADTNSNIFMTFPAL